MVLYMVYLHGISESQYFIPRKHAVTQIGLSEWTFFNDSSCLCALNFKHLNF